jgi:hypothetical protein
MNDVLGVKDVTNRVFKYRDCYIKCGNNNKGYYSSNFSSYDYFYCRSYEYYLNEYNEKKRNSKEERRRFFERLGRDNRRDLFED